MAEAEPLLSVKTSKPRCVPAAFTSFCFVSAPSMLVLSVTSANPSTVGSEPSAGTSRTPIATSVPSQERTCASVGPPSVALFAALSNSATSFGQLGKRAPTASRRFQASDFSSMLASAKATVEAGNAWAARPSVPGSARGSAGGTRAAAAGEHDAHQDERGERSQRRQRSVRRRGVMPALYDRRRIARLRPEAFSMPNIFEPDFNQRLEHPASAPARRLGWQLATERLGASIWEVEPGEAAYPYHYHLGEEELLVVLLGRPASAPTKTGANSSQAT